MPIWPIESLPCGTGMNTHWYIINIILWYNQILLVNLTCQILIIFIIIGLQSFYWAPPSMGQLLICGQLAAYLLSFFMENLFYQGKMRWFLVKGYFCMSRLELLYLCICGYECRMNFSLNKQARYLNFADLQMRAIGLAFLDCDGIKSSSHLNIWGDELEKFLSSMA